MVSVPPAEITIATDKRKTERRPLFCKVKLRSDAQCVECRSIDISKGGIAVIADINPSLGQRYKLQLSLPASDGRDLPIELYGQVVNVVLSKHRFRLGISFIDTDMRAQETLNRFLSG